MSYNRCHLVEEGERLRGKLTAGSMHQARWPGGGHLHSRVGSGGHPGPPGPGSLTGCDAWERAMEKEAVWVTVADDIQLGHAHSSDPGGRSHK